MFYMKEKLKKFITIRVLLHKTFYKYWSKIFCHFHACYIWICLHFFSYLWSGT